LGELTALPRLPSCIWGLLLREGREEKGRDRAEERTGGRGRGRGQRGGPEREGKGRAPMTLWHGAPDVLIRPCC